MNRGRQVAVFDLSDEAVATSRQSFDVAGFVGRIAQDVTKLFDGTVQAGIEVNKSVSRPEFLAELFARNDFAWMPK